MLRRWMAAVLLSCVCGSAAGSESHQSVSFASDVYPILRRACLECHGAKRHESDLRFDIRESALQPRLVAPGDPDGSELIRRITLPRGDAERMPAVGEGLSPGEIAILRRWIAGGAHWPRDFQPPQHWAYVAPIRPSVPSGYANPIDAFVMRKLHQAGKVAAPPADAATLMRRVHLDLTGLPPRPETVQEFLSNPTPFAFERIVDRLLQSPQFGERWARPWLDLARYADSHGFQRDDLREVWAYRDWVIRAMNRDMPFDQFTTEQIAGDLLPDATEAQWIATGFHRCAPTNVEAGSLPEETRVEQIFDRVNTTATVWLGSTLECAQCHDHKFDPFTMRDYYRLFAYFNNTEREADLADPKTPSSIKFLGPRMPLSDPVRDEKRDKLTRESRTIAARMRKREDVLDADLEAWAEKLRPTQRLPLLVESFASRGERDAHRIQDDQSVLLTGEPADRDDYVIEVAVPESLEIVGFRLEALRSPMLPGGGPGRGDPKRRNFVVNEIACEALDANQTSTTVAFASAAADFSQAGWPAAGVIDGDSKTGWAIAPKFNASHWIELRLKEPMQVHEGARFRFRIEQHFGRSRTMGRLRLLAVTGDGVSPPDEIAKLLGQEKKWSEAQRKRVRHWRAEQDSAYKRLASQEANLQRRIKDLGPDTTLVMNEIHVRETRMFSRGDYRTPGDVVSPGPPAALHAPPDGPADRRALAAWLVSRDNPLTARVVVNRWWAELFGRGLVATPDDFGVKGDPPSHPELLDWLALELIERGWSRKRILRTIVTSQTYQRTSAGTHASEDHRWLSRAARFRLDAESIRDNASRSRAC